MILQAVEGSSLIKSIGRKQVSIDPLEVLVPLKQELIVP